jgi:hypothetical protein
VTNGYRAAQSAAAGQEADVRPLIEIPRWDGKLFLAGMFILGYYSLVFIMAWRPLPPTNASLVRDAMLTLGPIVGLIFGSLFRTTGAEERRDALRSGDLRAAIETPTTVIAPPADEPPNGQTNGDPAVLS